MHVVTVVVADAFPNSSICGVPYHVSGEVPHWQDLAHRTAADLEATGMELRLATVARRVGVGAHTLWVTSADRSEEVVPEDALVVETGARPVRPPTDGLGDIGPEMAEALVRRGLQDTQMEQLSEVLSTVDPPLGAQVHERLAQEGVDVRTRTTVTRISRTPNSTGGRLLVEGRVG